MMNAVEFAKVQDAGEVLLMEYEKLTNDYARLGERGHIGLVGACISAGYDCPESIAYIAQKLVSPADLSNVMWVLQKGTGVTRQRRLWTRLCDGRYALRT